MAGCGGDLSPDSVCISTGSNLILDNNHFGELAYSGTFSGRGVVTGITFTPGSGLTPGVYLIPDTAGGTGTGAVIQVTVGSDGMVDIQSDNPNPVVVVNQGVYYSALPTFTWTGSGSAPTFTPTIGYASLINATTAFAGNTRNSVVSRNNIYAEVTPGNHIPVVSLNGTTGTWAYGNGSVQTGTQVSSEDDRTLIHAPNSGTLPQGWSFPNIQQANLLRL